MKKAHTLRNNTSNNYKCCSNNSITDLCDTKKFTIEGSNRDNLN